MRSWVFGTKPGEVVTMGVPSDGSYEFLRELCLAIRARVKTENTL